MLSPRNDSDQLLAAEQQLLGFLMESTAPPEVVRSMLERLKDYRFQSVEHQVLFDCVASLSTRRAGDILALLPAHLVRAGFPDFDLDRFLELHPMRAEQAMGLCKKLVPGQSQ